MTNITENSYRHVVKAFVVWSSTCHSRMFSTYRRLNTRRSKVHFLHFAGKEILCSDFLRVLYYTYINCIIKYQLFMSVTINLLSSGYDFNLHTHKQLIFVFTLRYITVGLIDVCYRIFFLW